MSTFANETNETNETNNGNDVIGLFRALSLDDSSEDKVSSNKTPITALTVLTASNDAHAQNEKKIFSGRTPSGVDGLKPLPSSRKLSRQTSIIGGLERESIGSIGSIGSIKSIKSIKSIDGGYKTDELVSPPITLQLPPSISQILYFSLDISQDGEKAIHLNNLFQSTIKTIDGEPFKKNDGFHSTILFVGGRQKDGITELLGKVGQSFTVEVSSIARNCNYIVLGINSIKDDSGDDIPYFGNPIKHLTVACREGFKPADSTSAFIDGNTQFFETPIIVSGTLNLITKGLGGGGGGGGGRGGGGRGGGGKK